MTSKLNNRIRSIAELYDILPEDERLIVDILRQLIRDHLPTNCKEKLSFNVPYFYGNKGICIVWPSAIPKGGIKKGVLLGFWYGNRIKDVDHYLLHGTNKQLFYKIYHSHKEINDKAIIKLLIEATRIDQLNSSI